MSETPQSIPLAGAGTAAGRAGSRVQAILFAAVGVLLVAALLYYVGVGEVMELLGALGWRAPLILVPYALLTAFDVKGWARALNFRARHGVSFWTLYWIRHAGEAVNALTPTAGMGGEPVKAYLLRRHGVNASDGVASVVIAKGALICAQIVFTLVGVMMFLSYFDLLQDRVLLLIGGWIVGLTVAAVIVIGQRRGLVAGTVRLLRLLRLRGGYVDLLARRAPDIDAALIRFYRDDSRGFAVAASYHLAAWVLGSAEVIFFLYLMGLPCGIEEAIIIEALTQAAMVSGVIVPGGLGVHELSGAVLCRMLGIGEAAGVALMLLKRAREIAFSLLGLALLSYYAGRPAARDQP